MGNNRYSSQLPALSDCNSIPNLHTNETRAEMCSQILVSLFVSVVFWYVVEVISSYDDCSFHFDGCDLSSENFASDGYVSCEWAFLIDIMSLDGFTRCLES